MIGHREKAVIDRAVKSYQEHGDNGGAYLLIALTTLASAAPDAAAYVLDRADAEAAKWDRS